MDDNRVQFEKQIENLAQKNLSTKSALFTREKLNHYISNIQSTQRNTTTKSQHTYHLLRKYRVENQFGTSKLICKKTGKYFIHLQELYDNIKAAHEIVGHGGQRRTFLELRKTIANVTELQIKTYLAFCTTCTIRGGVGEKRSKRVVRPLISSDFGERGQVDLIDMSGMVIGGYTFILNYQDHFSKFCILRALKTKTAKEVVSNLVHIFSTIGAPKILQADNGKEFVAKLFSKVLCTLWPELTIVHGRPRHPESQGSVERANGDVENMIRAILIEKRTKDWVAQLNFVQFCKNTATNRVIKTSPYKATFGRDPPLGFNQTFTWDILHGDQFPLQVEDFSQLRDNSTFIDDNPPTAGPSARTTDTFKSIQASSRRGIVLGAQEMVKNTSTPTQVNINDTVAILVNPRDRPYKLGHKYLVGKIIAI